MAIRHGIVPELVPWNVLLRGSFVSKYRRLRQSEAWHTYRLITFIISDLVLQEVNFQRENETGGYANASSLDSSDYLYDSESAFTPEGFGWVSGRDKDGLGHYVPFPHLIWYTFASPIIPGRVSFMRSYYGWLLSYYGWQFIGSNDDPCDEDSDWSVLCQDLSVDIQEKEDCMVGNQMSKFRCLGIRAFGRDGDNYVHIRRIRMWAWM